MTLGVRAIVENTDGKIVLVRHTYTPGLYLPGGGVERDEPALTALERELVEEAGIELSAIAELIGIFSNHAIMRNDHVLLYKAQDWRSVPIVDRGEIAEVIWADPLSPPSDITPATRRRLAEVYLGEAQSAYW
ncbi:MAG: NUDIX domain-containing protein [Pseudomonadota bacterium]